jgi:hypothetical protein
MESERDVAKAETIGTSCTLEIVRCRVPVVVGPLAAWRCCLPKPMYPQAHYVYWYERLNSKPAAINDRVHQRLGCILLLIEIVKYGDETLRVHAI